MPIEILALLVTGQLIIAVSCWSIGHHRGRKQGKLAAEFERRLIVKAQKIGQGKS